MKITVEMVLEKKPCPDYTEERLKSLLGNGKTLLEIADIGEVPEKDQIWCITKFLDDKTNRKFAIWCARSCKSGIREIENYIDVIEKYYDGLASLEDVRAADIAAYRATYMAAYRAADIAAYRAADRAADMAADRAAYIAAYRAADRAAYRAADRAADDTERKKQLEKLKEYINGTEKEGENKMREKRKEEKPDEWEERFCKQCSDKTICEGLNDERKVCKTLSFIRSLLSEKVGEDEKCL